MVDGAPKIAELAADLHKHLNQTAALLRIGAQALHSSLADLGGEDWPNPVPGTGRSQLISMPRSASKSSTSRSDRGYFTDIVTTRRSQRLPTG
jgi:hypothetical protein